MMMKLLLFAGTTEGRLLAENMAEMAGVEATVCVASEYGRETLGVLPSRFTVTAGRLEQSGMEQLMRRGFDLVVDATHPYAALVTANIRAAAQSAGTPCLRLMRSEGEAGNFRRFRCVRDAAAALCDTEGNVLITTGSKELEAYTVVPDYARRLYPRVLPSVESVRDCERLGFARSHIIAMQGPFSADLNKALMTQFNIHLMVTKNSGTQGGLTEKLEAARWQGAEVFIIDRPSRETGVTLEEATAIIKGRLEGKG